jgi:hypothetical protein
MARDDNLKQATLSWLLEEDQPGVRYLALRDLLELTPNDPELVKAQALAHQVGPINTILNQMQEQGWWAEPGPGYNPKYRSTVWSIIMLGQLGAAIDHDRRIETACRYLVDHALTEYGQFSASGTPGSTADCLQGNLLSALLDLGYSDPRLEKAFEWMARSLTGEGSPPWVKKHTHPLLCRKDWPKFRLRRQ